jgi:hypothetical protein
MNKYYKTINVRFRKEKLKMIAHMRHKSYQLLLLEYSTRFRW